MSSPKLISEMISNTISICSSEFLIRLSFDFFRVQDDHEVQVLSRTSEQGVIKRAAGAAEETGRSFKAKVLRRVFSEDFEKEKNNILDPRGQAISQWSKFYLFACLIALFVDPLFLLSPIIRAETCVDKGKTLQIILTIIRSLVDVFYVTQIFVKFHTAYIAPSSRVFGRGELVIDHTKVAMRYLRRDFWIDVMAALPLPQVCH